MVTMAELQEAHGVSTEVVQRTTHVAPSSPRAEDTRCPKCRMVCLTKAEHVTCTPYQRSVCIGVLTCSDCGGMAKSGLVECSKCFNKGYVLRFAKQWFDYACSACVFEARNAKAGLSKASTAKFNSVPVVTVTYHVPTVEQVDLYKLGMYNKGVR